LTRIGNDRRILPIHRKDSTIADYYRTRPTDCDNLLHALRFDPDRADVDRPRLCVDCGQAVVLKVQRVRGETVGAISWRDDREFDGRPSSQGFHKKRAGFFRGRGP